LSTFSINFSVTKYFSENIFYLSLSLSLLSNVF
jgi:hypothetical protein